MIGRVSKVKRRSVFVSLAILTLLTVGPRARSEEPRKHPGLDGGFVQLQGWMEKLSTEDWQRELQAMRDVRMELVIVQYVAYNDYSFLPEGGADADPVGMILRCADALGMKVFLGTKADDGWWKWDEAYLAKRLRERKELVEELDTRYGDHPSFAGWYFTEECSGGMETERVKQLRTYFRALSDHCKGLREQPVAFAPFFSEITPVEDLREIYSELLDGAGIDVMMPQDGGGVRGWDDDLEKWVVPVFAMFAEVCRERGVVLWCDLESFKQAPGSKSKGFVPTDADRLKRQLAAVGPFVEKVVTFDFFHYMSPYRGKLRRGFMKGIWN